MEVKKVRGGYRARLELFEVIRPTAIQARTDLVAHVETALAQSRRTPSLIDGGNGLIGIVWADPSGYSYSILNIRDTPAGAAVPARCFCAYHTFHEAERAARRHLAQYRFDPQNPADHAWFIMDPHDKAEHLDWVQWQRAYAEARQRGLSDEEAREYASGFRPSA